ncbi:MAG: AbrB/MazE/SpoVT family DNA-binding domain-containing protein, partial [Actinomycetota bacterium]
MDGTYRVTVGDRGRFVLPAELRERAALNPGSTVVLLETPRGVLLLTRDQLKDLVRDELVEADLVVELLAERRKAASI